MQILPSQPRWLPSWAKSRSLQADSSSSAPARVSFDIWPSESSVIVEGQQTQLPATFQLGAHGNKAVTLRPYESVRLSCVAGTTWVTKHGDATDYVLTPGEFLEVAEGGDVVALAINYGVLRVEPAANQ
jgi:hypothetical protein